MNDRAEDDITEESVRRRAVEEWRERRVRGWLVLRLGDRPWSAQERRRELDNLVRLVRAQRAAGRPTWLDPPPALLDALREPAPPPPPPRERRRCGECGGELPAGSHASRAYCGTACSSRVKHRRAKARAAAPS